MSLHRPLDLHGLLRPAARRTGRSHWRMHSPGESVGHNAAPFASGQLCEPPIVAQARDIIDTILADPDPGLADIQRRLREKVADHPGFPHKALLAHLLETRQRANS